MGILSYQSFFGLLVTFFLSGIEAACPNSWMNYQTRCYGVISVERSWMEAEVECQTTGDNGHLASLLSDPEQSAVANYFKNNYPDVERVWIGGYDPRRTGNWGWSDSSPLFFKAWNNGEPSNKNGRGFCMSISKKEGFKKWNTGDCQEKLYYLCKVKL